MKFCPNFSRVAWSHGETKKGKRVKGGAHPEYELDLEKSNQTAFIVRLRCGCWSCDFCFAKNQSIWRAFLADRLPQVASDWYMMTLTAHSRMRSTEKSYANLSHGVELLLKRARRVFGKVEYVRVYELHPTSEALHAHLIISGLTPAVAVGAFRNHVAGYLPLLEYKARAGVWGVKTWLKVVAHECHIGYQADLQKIDGNYATYYVTKYLTKSAQNFTIPNIRRIQTSRAIGSPKNDSEYKWQVGSFVTTLDFAPGERLIDLNTGEVLNPSLWELDEFYPPDNVQSAAD